MQSSVRLFKIDTRLPKISKQEFAALLGFAPVNNCKRDNLYFSRPVAINLIKLGAPLTLLYACDIGMHTVAMMVAGSFSTEELAAFGFATTLLISTVIALFALLGAIIPITANLKGAGDLASELSSLLRSALFVALLLSIMAVVALKLLELLLPVISTSPDISSLVEQYLRILIWIIPLELLAFTVIAISNGAGRTFWPAAINVIAFLTMLLAIWLFVYGNGGFVAMGSAGIAYSFLAAILAKCLLSVLLLFQSDFQSVTFASLTRSHDMPYFRRIFRVGLPIGFNEGSLYLYVALLVVFVASMGAEQLAAHNVAHNVLFLSHVFSLGFMGATSILVGQTWGAGDMAGMKSVRRTSTQVMLLASSPMLLAFLFLGEEIAAAYSIDGAAETIWLQICYCLLFLKLLDDVTLAGQGFLVGIEQTRTVFLGRVAGLWLVAMPIGYLLSWQYNVLGYWIGLAMGTALTLLWFVRAASIYLAQHNPGLVVKG